MAQVSFPSLDAAETVEVEFVKLDGSGRALKLLVDTGFTGRSSVVLGIDAGDLIRACLPAAQTTGALKGPQDRAWVTCRIPGLDFQATVIAIVTDISALSLPSGVEGMVGLTFLRHFTRWGAEQTGAGWQFVLERAA